MLKCLNDKRGFTLIEVTVAMFLVTVGVLGVFTVIQRTISFISISSSKLVASYLAQEGIETIRNIRDSNWLEDVAWDNGLTICSSGCEADYKTNTLQEETPLRPYGAGVYLNIDSDGFYSYSSGTITSLKRKIIIISNGPDILKISVEVFWEERGRTHSVTAQENLYNWY